MRNHRTEGGVLHRWGRTVTGEHVVSSAFVGGLSVGHRADDRDFVSDFRALLHVLGELHAGDVRVDGAERSAVLDWGERLRVPHFLVGCSTGQVDVNDGVCLRDELLFSGFCAELHEVAQREAEASCQTCEDELASRGGSEVSWVVHPSDCFLLVRVVHGFGLVMERIVELLVLVLFNPVRHRIFGSFSLKAERGCFSAEKGSGG